MHNGPKRSILLVLQYYFYVAVVVFTFTLTAIVTISPKNGTAQLESTCTYNIMHFATTEMAISKANAVVLQSQVSGTVIGQCCSHHACTRLAIIRYSHQQIFI